MSFWEVRQRSYFFGEKIVSDRIAIRDAILSATEISHRTKDSKIKGDPFAEKLQSIVYIVRKPRAEYIKPRREYMRKKNQEMLLRKRQQKK